MDSRRAFIKKSILLSGAAGLGSVVPGSIQRALAIDPAPGSTYLDAEHVVILMQENRSFDHCFGTLQGVRGFNDPRAITLPDHKPVWLQTNALGHTYAPFRLNIKDTKATWMGDLPHSRASQVDAYNGGKHDKWLPAKVPGNKKYAEMPLTLGYYNREDIPFNYAMADAFTVCDQNFCSAMTSTTPNRSFFWTGNITHPEAGLPKAHIRNDNYSYAKLGWKTFPELLEDNGISWNFYQNEISCGGGFVGEERSWLANFGCNLLEFFAAYNVKFAPKYLESLRKQMETLPGEIADLEERSPSSEEAARKIQADLKKKQEVLDKAREELGRWGQERYAKLSDREKQLFQRAFVTNKADAAYRRVSKMTYKEGAEEREVTVPEGDLLYQFRKDVNAGKLPTVSWLAGPQNFSDHPSAPWYGAWWVSEILDILTKNPEVWKKTIFIVTYDENDGYYDHVPPYSIPDENKPGTGKVSAGIDTEIEHVRLEHELKQGVPQKQAREAPIGLGFRVPMLIASPWSRGGRVCSQLFDHTSSLQFLETFVNRKFGKNIHVDNISQWRRTIAGDLTSAFVPFSKQQKKVAALNRDAYVERIHSAKFKKEPGGFKALSTEEMAKITADPVASPFIAVQEKGVRPSAALPYQLYAEARKSGGSVVVTFEAGNEVFGKQASGAPFSVYAPVRFTQDGAAETFRNWSFAVKAGDSIRYEWPLAGFENGYHLRVNAPNGFYREFQGDEGDPEIELTCEYEADKKTGKLSGNVIVRAVNKGSRAIVLGIKDQIYLKKDFTLEAGAKKTAQLILPLASSHGWYDFVVSAAGASSWSRRYAGRVETGKESFSDPYMGKVTG
ncbi:phospholipase C, phosphocholine-specific [Pedobacter yulinensis]|uniref:phospholipase C n=1 Tax=Pedobacter yulinensis TaxID=2126353 RepID=A0A2T3HQD1_9SPHI|nr:phospholipase C, phosphocholine-specific [Pedobacter yulinensis]PST84670.1 phospholipase C, phosphocholine-specific [Pedobacter yulinensis]